MGPEGLVPRRRAWRWLAVIVLPAALAACAESRLISHTAKQATREAPQPVRAPVKGAGVYKVGKPYQVAGVWYYPKEDPTYDETGVASWYGAEFHGKPTANGETFDMNEVTAAHQTLPMPSLVRVTNLENGRSIIVRVNDRGPFVNGRIIDLSRRSAQLLGTDRQGVAKVRVQMVGPASGDPNVAQPRPPVAPEEQQQVASAPRDTVVAEALPPPPGARTQPAAQQRSTAPRVPAAPVASAAAMVAASNVAPPQAQPVLEQQAIRQLPVKATNIFVQAGAFTQFDNANRLSARLSGLGPAKVSSAIVNGTEFFRVRLGPLNDVAQADRMLAYLIANGSPDAKILVE
jgi:rare lipoprotein A